MDKDFEQDLEYMTMVQHMRQKPYIPFILLTLTIVLAVGGLIAYWNSAYYTTKKLMRDSLSDHIALYQLINGAY